MRIREQLERIPDLAVEVELTRDAPNPGPERVGGGRPMPGSRPPLNVAVIDALRPILDPEDWHQTPLWHLVVAQRAARDELHAAGVPDAELPTPAEFPTYASEAGWLLATMDQWQAVADEFAYRFIEQGVNDCYSELARLAREPRPVVLKCQTEGCHGRIKPIPMKHGERTVLHAEVCEYGHPIDRVGATKDANPMPVVLVTIKQLAVGLGITVRHANRLVSSGLIQAAGAKGRANVYDLEESRKVYEWQKQGRLDA